jgi:hypothetical protein
MVVEVLMPVVVVVAVASGIVATVVVVVMVVAKQLKSVLVYSLSDSTANVHLDTEH